MRAAARLYLLAAIVLVPGACSYAAQRTQPYQQGKGTPVAADAGAELYQRDCAWCHGGTGEGTGRGPDLIRETNGEALTHFMLSTGRMPIDHPRARVARSDPAYDEATVADIVEHVATFGGDGPEIPVIDPGSGDLSQGLELYNENCAACHSVTGVGGALSADDPLTAQVGSRAPPIRGDAQEIAEAIITGPATMPVFEDTFTDEELDSLVRYALQLQDPEQRGGWGIGFLGPVTEGLVAWAIGLVALLFLIRWIGVSSRKK